MLYVDHIEGEGEMLFELVCERDLEGMVAKHRLSRYAVADHNPAWVKIRNRRYSQTIGRDELFEKRYEIARSTVRSGPVDGFLSSRSQSSVPLAILPHA